jgi:hypothetical protein
MKCPLPNVQVQLDDEVKRLDALERALHEAAARRDRQIPTYKIPG